MSDSRNIQTFEVTRYVVVSEVILIDAEDEDAARRQAEHFNPRTGRVQYSETVEVERIAEIRSGDT